MFFLKFQEDLQEPIQTEPSSSTIAVGETYQPVTVPGKILIVTLVYRYRVVATNCTLIYGLSVTNGTEPVLRVLPANAQVLLDASGNHYLTWQGPEGTQLVQVQVCTVSFFS